MVRSSMVESLLARVDRRSASRSLIAWLRSLSPTDAVLEIRRWSRNQARRDWGVASTSDPVSRSAVLMKACTRSSGAGAGGRLSLSSAMAFMVAHHQSDLTGYAHRCNL